jgi:hypothetical protein
MPKQYPLYDWSATHQEMQNDLHYGKDVVCRDETSLHQEMPKDQICPDADGNLRAVAIVSRPPNRNSDDGVTCEVVRLASDGTRNACSFLYSACAKIARDMGFQRMITYTLDSESGASLRAGGWKLEKVGIRSWWQSHQVSGRTVKAREHYAQTKQRWSAPQMAFGDEI